MAAIIVSDVIERAQVILQDTTGTRWSEKELLEWLNDAQLAVVNRRPDTYVQNETFNCIAGTRQTIPPTGLKLIRVLRNGTVGSPIRYIDMRILDDQVPDWHVEVGTSDVKHFTADTLDPKTFYLYPAPVVGHAIQIVYSSAPATITAVSDTITLDDSYLNPILDFMLYRAYSKDANYTQNASRASMHLDAFRIAIGDKTQADVAMTESGR
jgi:hypothetical protein